MTYPRQLRRRSTDSEQLLWAALRNRGFLGLKFRRQHPIGAFIVDFYCPEIAVAIEVDGRVHDGVERRGRDETRQEFIEGLGIRFIRIRAEDVETRFESTLAWLEHQLRNVPPLHDNGEGVGG